MSKYIDRRWVVLAVSALLSAACSTEKKQDTLASDSSMQLANHDSAAQPQLSDVPPAATTPQPAATTPRTTPSTTPRTSTTKSGNTVTRSTGTHEAGVGTIPAGSTLSLSSSSRVCTNTNKVGDHITATVREAVAGSNGAVIPAGATATLEITALKRSENANDKIVMTFRPVSIAFGGHTYPIAATVASADIERVRNEPSKKDAQKVATGAAVGAVVGQILGKNTRSTVIGGAVGAAAGAGAAVATANYEGCIPSGGHITVTLSDATQVHVAK